MRARVILDHLAWHFAGMYRVEGYYDDAKPVGSSGPGGLPILGDTNEGIAALAGGSVQAFLALGTYKSWRSYQLLKQLRDAGVRVPSLIAPSALVSPSAIIGDGALVMAGVFVGAELRIGDLFTAHGGVTIEHHGQIGDNVLIGPGTTLCGCVTVNDHCFLGAGTRVIPERIIGTGSITGAGSVVVRDIPAGMIALGSPARLVRSVGQNDEVPRADIIEKLQAARNT